MNKDYQSIEKAINWINNLGHQSESLFNRISAHLQSQHRFEEYSRYAPYYTKRLFATSYYHMGMKIAENSRYSLDFILFYAPSETITHRLFEKRPALYIMKIENGTGYLLSFPGQIFNFFSEENSTVEKSGEIFAGKITMDKKASNVQAVELDFSLFDDVDIENFLKNSLESALKKLNPFD